MKKCSTCKIEKELFNFHKVSQNKDGLHEQCKKCRKEKAKCFYEDNRDSILEKTKKYCEDHKETRLKYEKRYKEEHKEEIVLYHKRRYEENREEIIAHQCAYIKERRKNDPIFRLIGSMRTRLNKAIKNNQKVGSAIRDLGCSINFFKGYIEAQWYANLETGEKMTWDNYGLYGWHLDHRISLSSFDLTDREQFLKACHFSNLQPLWAKDNRRKGKK